MWFRIVFKSGCKEIVWCNKARNGRLLYKTMMSWYDTDLIAEITPL